MHRYIYCATCVVAGVSNYNNCKKCAVDASGKYLYHFIYNKAEQCIPESEKPSNTYLDEEDNTYKRCYTSCATCSKGGSSESHNCNTCASGYHLIVDQPGMCIKESNCPDGYYLDEEDDTYKKCYDTCKKCTKGGDSTSHNCAKCADGYYFIYNKVGYCIKQGEQPNNTYLDDDTYRECYSTCGTCEKAGSQTSNNCKTCYVYINGTYAYHFIYTQEGQCVGDDQKCTNCYLDEDDNTYKKCYDTCGTHL